MYNTDPYNLVDNYNQWEVSDFENDSIVVPDSLFGLGKNRQKKKAEKKLHKAEVALAHGNTRKAARKLKKGTAILNKIDAGQSAALSAENQLASINNTQAQIAANSAAAQQQGNPSLPTPAPLSVQPMSAVGSSIGAGGSGGMADTSMNVGADSSAPDNAPASDTPTGDMANVKTLPNVTVTSHKGSKTALILIGAVLLIIAIVYFAPKLMKK